MDLGFCLVSCGKIIDMEKELNTYSSQEREARGAAWESTWVGQEAEAARNKCGPEPFLWFPREGMGGTGLASLGKFRIG